MTIVGVKLRCTHNSPTLPETTNIAIIGSGITSLSVLTLTILVARTLCSGATGRNGDQLTPNAGEMYLHLVSRYGSEVAAEIVRFTFENLKRIRDLAGREESEVVEVEKVRVFLKEFERFRRGVKALKRDLEEFRGVYTVLERGVLKVRFLYYGLDGARGALVPAGTVWPSPSHPYVLHTPRGCLRATKIVHCTNGHVGHLIPGLRGQVYPFNGTMAVQDTNSAVTNRGAYLPWGFYYPAVYDRQSGRYGAGLYYLMQNAKTDHFFFGGEDTQVEQCLSSDDSQQKLPRFLGHDRSEEWKVISAWSGITGFSADGLPVVGRANASMTGWQGDGEYVAAAFNGYGMANCLLAGEALAKMMLGEYVA
ncbi:hypothetical protein BDV29DRAFT_197696 [Aspergillus leporis]|uniref:FAD dependent oxidoreductase domain-containing protein n=1 Tax=Aspergillus leporis TaxID=41062 RepID=A0A5N5WT94_9EURO|nr:hypothetical protein BDV29DRAFT_197696 [Aspergillus leporis]